MNTCKYEKMQRWVSYDSGITWSPMDEYQKGELIERDSVDCGWEPTPPTPEVEYRWVDIPLENDFYCSGTTKYYKQKMQQSEDSGTTWTDVVPPQYRMGASAQSESSDCGYAERTTSGSPYCDDGNKVVMIYYQVSDDHGASWTTTSSTENIIEYDVAECGYATRTTSGSPYCVGVDKCVDLYHQVTRDGGTTWTTTSTTVSVIERNSEDCGYVPHDYSKDYFTFKALEDGTFKSNVSLEYSLDSGETWTSLASNTNTPTVLRGQTIMWKGNKQKVLGESQGVAHFSSTGAFDAQGNIMSIVYGDDFIGNTRLTTSRQFMRLFQDCTNLISAENLILPSTALIPTCYSWMFAGCTSLTTAPELPATTLSDECYSVMFYGCSSLTTAPELPATTLASNCYNGMFNGCTSLTTAPQLPATTLAYGCYEIMFAHCSSLTTAPELPATTLSGYCYNAMFRDCTSLTTAPELPATTLVDNCYQSMFRDCTSLTTAPELPATTLASYCYNYMFWNCTSLNTMTCFMTVPYYTIYTCDWVYGVPQNGTYYKSPSGVTTFGVSAIPQNWVVKDVILRTISGTPYCSGTTKVVDVSEQRSIDNGTTWTTTSTTISVLEYDSADCGYAEREISGTPYCSGSRKVVDVYHQESEDSGTTWTTTSTTVSVVEYDSTDCGYDPEGDYLTFKVWVGGSFKFSNAISYSLDGGVTWNQLPANTSTPQLQMGDIIKWKGNLTPSQGSGIGTFSTFASFNVYGNIMSLLFGDNFSGQTSLSGYDYAFYSLFEGCEVQLANNLILPATTLAPYCYANMFLDCSILAYAPKLPAPTLVEGCYNQMFSYCDQMNYIECLATNPSWQYSYSWLVGTSSSGVFIKDANTTWPSGGNGIPNDWTVIDYQP